MPQSFVDEQCIHPNQLKKVPDVVFKTRVRDESMTGPNPFRWQDRTTREIFGGRRVVLFGLPGAFTPTCSSTHLPRYDKLYDKIKSQGIDEVICLSVNDAFVMFQWGKHLGVKKVFLLPDGNGEFTRKIGMLVEKSNYGFGERSWRYSMVVNDCRIEKLFVEQGRGDNRTIDPFEVSDADTMLAYLSELHNQSKFASSLHNQSKLAVWEPLLDFSKRLLSLGGDRAQQQTGDTSQSTQDNSSAEFSSTDKQGRVQAKAKPSASIPEYLLNNKLSRLSKKPGQKVSQETDWLADVGSFVRRHIGPRSSEFRQMLNVLGFSTLELLIEKTVPQSVKLQKPLQLAESESEYELIGKLKQIASKNQVFRSLIGMGYYNCITPPVILRNILENPGWYTQYTPYQPEIAQGRLEVLLNFQTMAIELTGMEVANASLLDEGTAAAEAMTMSYNLQTKSGSKAFWVSSSCHPQTIEVVRTRAKPLGIEVIVGNHQTFDFNQPVFGVLLQYPASDGSIYDYQDFINRTHKVGALAIVAADLLSLTLLKPPGEFGADIVVGSTQRFGCPLGYGGPHAAYLATKEAYVRQIPGRIVGMSKDVHGLPALRLALQTREQHIRREKATSNICTAAVLMAVIATMYATYHGPEGLKQIAQQIHRLTAILAAGLQRLGYQLGSEPFFDTLRVEVGASRREEILNRALARSINLRLIDTSTISISLDETTKERDLIELFEVFAGDRCIDFTPNKLAAQITFEFREPLARTSPYLSDPVFNSYHSETELLRYMHRLQAKDLSLTTAMIPLGSCTMKLTPTSAMLPVTWPEFAHIHPFAPLEQTQGYQILLQQLEQMLAEVTGFAGVSLQPNAGAQGEYAGLLVIRQYHEHRGEGHRNICLIPQSAHGTNPASAVMAGMQIVVIDCDQQGNIDVADLKAKAKLHQDYLAALMVTYPSTHGVFEESIREICTIVHTYGGQVYMDGANMNGQVGLCSPGDIGADVCHLNLHKTFGSPHGGGGPGMGPIGVATHLLPFLPNHPVVSVSGEQGVGPVASAPWGSAGITPIPWVYISLMGSAGLTKATQVAILNANYITKRLEPYYPILYRGKNGLVAHECILDLRQFKKTVEIEVDDIAKRLIDYGFHPPTVSFPVPGTMMVEPTESESKQELDRFCDAMIAIRAEIREIELGQVDRQNNVLKNAPHTVADIVASEWNRPYSREQAVYPTAWTREHKFWPAVGRIDNAYGDRNLVCSCLPIDAYK